MELFPAAQERQQQLSVEEVDEIKTETCLDTLEYAAEGADQLLQNSVQQIIAGQSSHRFSNNIAKEEARVRYGDEHTGNSVALAGAGHLYDGNEASGKSRVHYGNRYGGKGVLDD